MTLKRVKRVSFEALYVTVAAVPWIAAPPLREIENALPATASPVSRFSDQVTVTVTPSVSIDAAAIVGAVVSTTKERVALYEEAAVELSTFFARQ